MKKTVRLTMAQALLRFLDNQYISIDGEERKFVKGVFGIFGHGNATGIGEALEFHRGGLTYYQGKNEQGMAHAAIAYAKQKNRLEIMACTSSIGPGALNMVTAAGLATVNRIPVLFLPGDIFASRQPDPVLQQVEDPTDYTISANDAFKPVSRYWDRVSRPEQLMTAMINAMRVLTDPVNTGAVTISLPQDVQAEAYDYPEEFFNKRVHYIDRTAPAKNAVQRAVELLKSKKRPVIIAGGGVHYSLATEELKAFAEAFQIPVTETQAGKSVLPWSHPLNLGAVGANGSLSGNKLAREADVVIAVGTRLTDFPTASKSAFQNPDVSFIGLNVSNFDAIKLDACPVVGDARESLQALQEALSEAGYQSSYTADEIAALKKQWDDETDRHAWSESAEGLTQTRVIGEVNRAVGEDAVIVCAAGSLPGDLLKLWRCEQPKTYHMEYGFSCMGYEISGALGVKMAEPDREVYALVGDGGFLMLHSELVTAIQERRKINVVLFDNGGFQCIHGLQNGQGSEGFGNEFRFRSEETGRLTGDYMPIDFAAVAKGFGAVAYTVRTIDELRQALEDAKKQTVSTLIDIKVLPRTGMPGYDSWWRLGVAEVSDSEEVLKAHAAMEAKAATARPY